MVSWQALSRAPLANRNLFVVSGYVSITSNLGVVGMVQYPSPIPGTVSLAYRCCSMFGEEVRREGIDVRVEFQVSDKIA